MRAYTKNLEFWEPCLTFSGTLSYMSVPTLSYTLRIPVDLKRLLESAAESGGVSMAAVVIEACWMHLDVRGGSIRAAMARCDREEGLGPRQPSSSSMSELRELVAGKITSHEACDPEVALCGYKEYSQDIGEWMGCGLPAHGLKQRHSNWRRL